MFKHKVCPQIYVSFRSQENKWNSHFALQAFVPDLLLVEQQGICTKPQTHLKLLPSLEP